MDILCLGNSQGAFKPLVPERSVWLQLAQVGQIALHAAAKGLTVQVFYQFTYGQTQGHRAVSIGG